MQRGNDFFQKKKKSVTIKRLGLSTVIYYLWFITSQCIFISFCFARNCGFGPICCFLSTVCFDELNDRDIYVDAASYSLQLPIPSKDTVNFAWLGKVPPLSKCLTWVNSLYHTHVNCFINQTINFHWFPANYLNCLARPAATRCKRNFVGFLTQFYDFWIHIFTWCEKLRLSKQRRLKIP